MKVLFPLLVSLVSLQALAQDLGLKHQAACETPEIKEALRINGGSCQILVSFKEAEIPRSACFGILDKVPCMAEFVSTQELTSTRITCGSPEEPILQEAYMAEAKSYRISTLVRDGAGRETVSTVNKSFIYFESPLKLQFEEAEGKKSATISYRLFGKVQEFTQVECMP